MDNKDASIVDSSCACKSSSMGRCSHIAGLLFALEDYTIQFGHKPTSSTSKLCQWNVGRKKRNNPQPAHEANYNNKKATPNRIITHDPRPMGSETEQSNRNFANMFIATLPNVANNTMFATVLEIVYEDYTLGSNRRLVLCELVNKLVAAMEAETGNAIRQLDNTTEQANADAWHTARRWRVTASNCKRVATTKSIRGMYTLLQHLLWGKFVTTKSMEYGKLNENRPRIWRRHRGNLPPCRADWPQCLVNETVVLRPCHT